MNNNIVSYNEKKIKDTKNSISYYENKINEFKTKKKSINNEFDLNLKVLIIVIGFITTEALNFILSGFFYPGILRAIFNTSFSLLGIMTTAKIYNLFWEEAVIKIFDSKKNYAVEKEIAQMSKEYVKLLKKELGELLKSKSKENIVNKDITYTKDKIETNKNDYTKDINYNTPLKEEVKSLKRTFKRNTKKDE